MALTNYRSIEDRRLKEELDYYFKSPEGYVQQYLSIKLDKICFRAGLIAWLLIFILLTIHY